MSSKSSRRSQKSGSSARERAAEEKACLAELLAEPEFLEEGRAAEIASEKVRIKQQIAKAAARVKVFEELEESVCSKKSVTEEVQSQNISFLQEEKNSYSNVKDWITANRDNTNRPRLLQRERAEPPRIHVGNLVQQQRQQQQQQPHTVSFGIRKSEQGTKLCVPKIHKEEIPQQCRAQLPPQPNVAVKLQNEPREDTVVTDKSAMHAATLSGLFDLQNAPNYYYYF